METTVKQILRELFLASEPPIDIFLNKDVDYNNHKISQEKYEQIIEQNLADKKLTKLKNIAIKNTIAMYSPIFK